MYARWGNKKTLAVHKVFEWQYMQNNVEKYVLVTQALDAKNTCRACSPIVGVAVFARKDGQWFLEAENKELDRFGAMGVVFGKMDVVRIGPGKYGVVHEIGHGAHQDCDGMAFRVITLQDGLRSLDVGDEGGTSYCNEYCENCGDEYVQVGEWNTRISFDDSSSGAYYDVLLQSTHREGVRSEIDTKTRRYRFSGNEYKEITTGK